MSDQPTLRDQFAMAALSGGVVEFEWIGQSRDASRIATAAYKIADAMMKARGPVAAVGIIGQHPVPLTPELKAKVEAAFHAAQKSDGQPFAKIIQQIFHDAADTEADAAFPLTGRPPGFRFPGEIISPLAEAPEDFKPELLKQYVTPEEWKQRTSGLGQPITEEMLDPATHKNHPVLDGLRLTHGETK